MKLFRSIDTPLREGLNTQKLWFQEDNGLIACWERGRAFALEQEELAKSAKAGELVVLPWKGGVEHATKNKKKYGTFRYLAMWQGLRNESLNIDTDIEREITCSQYGVTVLFTDDAAKYAGA